MTTGFERRFKGKIKVAVLYLGSGGIVDSSSGIAGKALTAQRLSLLVTATANTDFTVSVPPGATITGVTVYTSVAFGAATDITFQMGASAGDNSYIAAISIKALGVVKMAFAAGANVLNSVPAGTPNVFIRLIQTGAASATGSAVAVIDYVMP